MPLPTSLVSLPLPRPPVDGQMCCQVYQHQQPESQRLYSLPSLQLIVANCFCLLHHSPLPMTSVDSQMRCPEYPQQPNSHSCQSLPSLQHIAGDPFCTLHHIPSSSPSQAVQCVAKSAVRGTELTLDFPACNILVLTASTHCIIHLCLLPL